jgi:apolipoprotein N-acyltransferase
MQILAAISTPAPGSALARLGAIPVDFWLRLGLAVVALVLLVVFLRKVAKMNKVVLAAITFVMVTVVGFNWIYERNEPEWARPVVGFLAGFFPSKGLPAKTAALPPAKMRP